jgi:hypothetical protein
MTSLSYLCGSVRENQAYKNGIPDKQSGFDHITEAGGYCVFKNLFEEYHKYYNYGKESN